MGLEGHCRNALPCSFCVGIFPLGILSFSAVGLATLLASCLPGLSQGTAGHCWSLLQLALPSLSLIRSSLRSRELPAGSRLAR